MMKIRTAHPEDAALLVQLGRSTFQETFAADNSPEDMKVYLDANLTLERLDAHLGNKCTTYLLAEDSGKAIGFAKLVVENAPRCITGLSPIRLEKLYVTASVIGSGVGAALMRSSIDQAIATGRSTLWLGVWERNRRAMIFYEKWGFVPVGDEVFRLGNDVQRDVLMQLRLDTPKTVGPT